MKQQNRVSRLGDDFTFGVATSAYQIEGAVETDGRGRGIWDTFSERPGAIRNGDSARVACDHYRRYAEDVGLLRELGVSAYRMSISWPRILPLGTGAENTAGLDYYDRLLDALLEAGIEPWLTLYHWDLPDALEARGGWRNRDVADWLTEFALLAQRRFGDRVRHWIVLNEACMTSHRGHAFGTDAPGLSERAAFFAAMHHQNLAQGRTIAALRAACGDDAMIGTSVLLQPALPQTDDQADHRAAKFLDATWNRAALDPLLLGHYPELLHDDLEPWLRDSDAAEIQQPIDFLGVNYYVRSFVQADDDAVLGLTRARGNADRPQSPFGMEIYPEGLVGVLAELRRDYGNPLVYVTETGYADTDDMPREALIADAGRIDYLCGVFDAIGDANAAGSRVRGLFVWSLLDNFEWEFGYWARFGLVHVDYDNQRRTPKQSFHWYAEQIARARRHAG